MTKLVVKSAKGNRLNPQTGVWEPLGDNVYDVQSGDFLSAYLVTDSTVYEVVKATPKTLTLRSTRQGDIVERESKTGLGRVYYEVLPNIDGDIITRRAGKDGCFRLFKGGRGGAFSPCRKIDGKPVKVVDWSF